MKEQLYTIPLTDAMNAQDECPFCFIERTIEQYWLNFTLGSCASYMERDVRAITDKEGFCRTHFKKMFDYGNTLGNGWILKSHFEQLTKEMTQEFKSYQPSKKNTFAKFKKSSSRQNAISIWAAKKDASCYICNRYEETYARYLDTFFMMYKKDADFKKLIATSKGFCISHFGDLCEAADSKLNEQEQESFFALIFPLMEENMNRLTDDVSWLVDKFDYRNKEADWKNSKDAIQRGMQKLAGGYPADSPYKSPK